MLNDEEKEALEILNNTEWDGFMITIKNLIEKQSKEIEELKEDNKHQWEERCKLTFELENSTPNDKIKAKIEELKLIADNGANAVRFAITHDDEVERIQKQKDISAMIDILQSLLERSNTWEVGFIHK